MVGLLSARLGLVLAACGVTRATRRVACCYSACYSPCYDSCGLYLGWRPGPIRRLLFGPYRWYWGGCYSWLL